MRWPKLVPPEVCHTPVTICLTDGNDEDGSPKVVRTLSKSCNYSEKARQVIDAQRHLVQLEATALLDGDIAPGLVLAGSVELPDGTVRAIYRSERPRNPDGTVNYTKLELM